MIILNAPLKRIEKKKTIESDFPVVRFISDVGMIMTFESIEGNDEENPAAIKAAIKKTEYEAALFSQVTVE